MDWYKEKRDIYRKKWEAAQNGGDEKAAANYMREFTNYSQHIDYLNKSAVNQQ